MFTHGGPVIVSCTQLHLFSLRGDVDPSLVVIIVNPATVNSGGCYCTVRRPVDLVA